MSETEEERNIAVARKDLEHYDFTCTTYTTVWEQIKAQVDKIRQELKVQILYVEQVTWYSVFIIDFLCWSIQSIGYLQLEYRISNYTIVCEIVRVINVAWAITVSSKKSRSIIQGNRQQTVRLL